MESNGSVYSFWQGKYIYTFDKKNDEFMDIELAGWRNSIEKYI
jgi:hypothetical protein